MLTALNNIWLITRRELRAFGQRPIFFVIMFVAPLGFLWMFIQDLGKDLLVLNGKLLVHDDMIEG